MATKTFRQAPGRTDVVSDADAVFHVQCPHCEKPFLARDSGAQTNSGLLAAGHNVQRRLADTLGPAGALTGLQGPRPRADVSRPPPSKLSFWSVASACVGLASFLALFLRSQRPEPQPLPTRLAPAWHTRTYDDGDQTPSPDSDGLMPWGGEWQQMESLDGPAMDGANRQPANP